MSEIEHFQNGIALIRNAMEIPEEIIDELLVISKGQWEHQYVVEGDEVVNKATGTRTPIEFHGQEFSLPHADWRGNSAHEAWRRLPKLELYAREVSLYFFLGPPVPSRRVRSPREPAPWRPAWPRPDPARTRPGPGRGRAWARPGPGPGLARAWPGPGPGLLS